MPRYDPAGAGVRLSVMDLASSITESLAPEIGQDHTKNVKSIIQELRKRERETALKVVDSGLQFLGVGKDMPFFLVTTMKEPVPVLDANSASSSVVNTTASGFARPVPSTSTSIALASVEPRALYMSIHLTNKAFLPDDYPQTSLYPPRQFLDVKVDIYYNGELTVSTFLPASRRPAKDDAESVARFAGRRVDDLVERPWLMSGRNKSPVQGNAAKRWDDVAALLKKEANRMPTGPLGRPTVLEKYLSSLAETTMPLQAMSLQKQGEANLGIIDVVLTSGRGERYIADNFPLHQGPKSMAITFPPCQHPTATYRPSQHPTAPTATVPTSTFNFGPTAKSFSAPPAPAAAAVPVPARASARARSGARAPASGRNSYTPFNLTAARSALTRLPPSVHYRSQQDGDVKYRVYLDQRIIHSRHYRENEKARKPAREAEHAAREAEQLWAPGPVPNEIHRDSQCTYEPGVYRQADWDRGGKFEERKVLVGWRFLVRG